MKARRLVSIADTTHYYINGVKWVNLSLVYYSTGLYDLETIDVIAPLYEHIAYAGNSVLRNTL